MAFSCSAVIKIVFPDFGSILISGSEALVKLKLKSLKPLNTDKTISNAIELAIIPNDAIPVIIFIDEFLLKLKKYLFAIYKEKFNLSFLSFF